MCKGYQKDAVCCKDENEAVGYCGAHTAFSLIKEKKSGRIR
jgi:hypothetical protein